MREVEERRPASSRTKGCLASIITGLLIVSAVVASAFLVDESSGFITGVVFIVWSIFRWPTLPLMAIFGGSVDQPTLPTLVLTIIFDVLACSTLAYALYWGRRR